MCTAKVSNGLSVTDFWSKVKKTEGCWEWQAGKTGAGYGRYYDFKDFFPTNYAHRLSYILTNGPIPAGLVIRHACDNPGCVNPDHLSTGTKADNSRDMVLRGRQGMQKRTHCKRGHEITLENTHYNRQKNCRSCSICAQDTNRRRDEAYRARQKEKRLLAAPIEIALPPDTHICMDCGTLTPTSKSRKFRCKPCQNSWERQYRERNREQSNANSRAYKARKRATAK